MGLSPQNYFLQEQKSIFILKMSLEQVLDETFQVWLDSFQGHKNIYLFKNKKRKRTDYIPKNPFDMRLFRF